MIHFGIEIIGIDIQRKTNLLDLNDLLVFFRFLLPLCPFKTILAVIHNAANRRNSLRGNFYQVEILFNRNLHRILCCHNSQLATVCIDDTDFPVSDLFVDLQFFVANVKAPPL